MDSTTAQEPPTEGKAELLAQYDTHLTGADGAQYVPRVYGQQQADGSWLGWVEFAALASNAIVFATDVTTTEPSRQAIIDWAKALPSPDLQSALHQASNALGSA